VDTSVGGFVKVISTMQDGTLERELTEQLSDIVAALTDQARERGGKPKAKLALTLIFTLDSGMVEVTGDVKVTQPKPVLGKSIFWPTNDNQLSPENPRQLEMPLRDVAVEGASHIRRA
jgi:hypothetical protein